MPISLLSSLSLPTFFNQCAFLVNGTRTKALPYSSSCIIVGIFSPSFEKIDPRSIAGITCRFFVREKDDSVWRVLEVHYPFEERPSSDSGRNVAIDGFAFVSISLNFVLFDFSCSLNPSFDILVPWVIVIRSSMSMPSMFVLYKTSKFPCNAILGCSILI